MKFDCTVHEYWFCSRFEKMKIVWSDKTNNRMSSELILDAPMTYVEHYLHYSIDRSIGSQTESVEDFIDV